MNHFFFPKGEVDFDKVDFDKGQEKRVGGREVHLLSPLALLFAFEK